MLVPVVLATVCLASSTVLAAYDKPLYDVEDAENLFKDFVKDHKKVYNRREYFERFEIFKETLKDINERNAMFPDTTFAVNHFADLKPHELQHYLGFKPSNETIKKVKIPNRPHPLPEGFDWRYHHAVSHVKSQKLCGSCFIFSAIGNIEGQYAIKHGKCLALSEGQALDCLDSGTCSGGSPADVMGELVKKKLEKEEHYTYNPFKGVCKEDDLKGVVQMTGEILQLDIEEEMDLRGYLVHFGPLSIGVNAKDFFHYNGGILEPSKCTGLQANHAVLLVGYGEENGKLFWSIKNSWGAGWGEKGYLRLSREGNACDIFGHVLTTSVF
ncbi:uncharacterized protein LOC134743308 [Cydia strobilella]|uniref:uncharacterized protein LOC134743308 n=1 Tax=Cydia strobilella TaxID=1100964 RepID=UPI003007934D